MSEPIPEEIEKCANEMSDATSVNLENCLDIAPWHLAKTHDLKQQLANLEARCGEMREALAFYASPETYHAILILPDNPSGDFINDFSDDHGDDFYNRAMPGKMARQALKGST